MNRSTVEISHDLVRKTLISLFTLLPFLAFILPPISSYADTTTGLIGWWKFDDGTGTTALDSSPSGLNGVLTGSPLPIWVVGHTGDALKFNGTSDYVDIPNSQSTANNLANFTVSAWFNTTNSLSGIDYTLVGKVGVGGIPDGIGWFIGAEYGVLVAELHIQGEFYGPSANVSGYSLNNGQWHLVTATFVNTGNVAITMYIDGAPLAYQGDLGQSTITPGTMSNTNNIRIAGNYDGPEYGLGFFPGSLDDVRIYNRVLSAADIQQLYTGSGGTVTATPTVTAQSASSISQTSATLNGTLTATGSNTVTIEGFNYGLTASYGSTISTTGSFNAGTFSQSVSGLACNTTYHFQAYAVNSDGTGTSTDQTFTTSACTPVTAPAITTQAASSIEMNSATLNGTITSTGGANITQSGFVYGTNSTLSSGTVTTTLGAQSGDVSFSSSVTPLACNTTYYFRAYATNSKGTGFGTIKSFVTSACVPTVTSSAATSIGTSSATFNGTIIATGGANATSRGFNYGTTASYGLQVSAPGSFSTGAFAMTVSNLACGTTYHFSAFATNSSGTGSSTDRSFTTATCPVVSPPSLSTSAATLVATSTVTLNATISSTGGANITQSGFAYGTDPTLTATNTVTSALGAQSGVGNFSQSLSNLTPNTTYYFRAYASNSQGTSWGSTLSFTTLVVVIPAIPTVTAQSASSIGQASATLNGTLTATGSTTVTTIGFNYGLTSAYGSTISTTGSFNAGTFSQLVSGLACNTTYHFNAFAVNSVGTGTSADQSFTTGTCSGVDPSLICWWKFDDGTGTTALDSGSSGLNGVLTGSPLPIWIAGEIGDALQFNGANNYVDIPNSQSTADNLTNFTVSAWFNTTSSLSGVDYNLVGKVGVGGVPTGIGWFIGAEYGVLVAQLQNQGDYYGPSANLSGYSLNNGQWHLVTATFVNTGQVAITMYIDGVPLAYQGDQGDSTIKPGTMSNTNNIRIAGNYDGPEYGLGFFPGSLDDVRIYNRVLSAEEIQQLYQAAQ